MPNCSGGPVVTANVGNIIELNPAKPKPPKPKTWYVYLMQTAVFVLCYVALVSLDIQCRIWTSPNTKDEIWPREGSQ